MKRLLMIVCAAIIAAGAVTWYVHQMPSGGHSAGAYSIQSSGGGAQPVNLLAQATTTPCSIAGPSSATTSIMHFALTVTTGTSSAGTFAVGTSTTPYATSSTPFATFVIPANSQSTFSWDGGVNNDHLSPGTFIVGGMTNGSAVGYGYTYTGTCSTILVTD